VWGSPCAPHVELSAPTEGHNKEDIGCVEELAG
jgi:hypothetical protein